MLSATGDLAERSVAPPLDLRQWVRYFPKFVKRNHLSRHFLKIAHSILPLNSNGYAVKEKDVHFTAFKVIETEAVLSFVTVLFAPVSNVFKNIETNYGLVIETKVQGEKIATNNKCVGEGYRGEKQF